MDIIVKAQPKAIKELVRNNHMCNLKFSGPQEQQATPTIDPLLEQDDKALFYINYSSLVENPVKQEKNIHAAIARNQSLQMKYSTNATGIYTIFHKKHFIIGGNRGKPNHSVVYKTEEDKKMQVNQSKADLNKLWLIVKKV